MNFILYNYEYVATIEIQNSFTVQKSVTSHYFTEAKTFAWHYRRGLDSKRIKSSDHDNAHQLNSTTYSKLYRHFLVVF